MSQATQKLSKAERLFLAAALQYRLKGKANGGDIALDIAYTRLTASHPSDAISRALTLGREVEYFVNVNQIAA